MLASDPHFQRTQQEASDSIQELRRQTHDRDMRVATWLLVGNGAALLACFNAVIGGSVSDWDLVQPFALIFLLGMTCAIGSVVFEGESDSRANARLILMSGATRRAAICIDANAEFRASQLAQPNVDIEAQIKENDDVIADARDILEKNSEEPKWDRRLRRLGRIVLGISALCLGGALYFAIVSDALEAAIR